MNFLGRIQVPFSRFALFVVFFWFGILKLIGTSPANPMVEKLLGVTMPFMSWQTFIVLFAFYEMIIGISFLAKGYERLALGLLLPHLLMTGMPLLLLPEMTWQAFMTPTLEGQYIVKNLLILAVALGIINSHDNSKDRQKH